MTIRATTAATVGEDNTITPASLSTATPPFFRTNWREPVTVTRSWQTAISASIVRRAEQRVGTRSRPLTGCSSLHTALDISEIYGLQSLAYSATPELTLPTQEFRLTNGLNGVFAYPLASDAVEITAVVDLGGQFDLTVDLSDGFRFFSGARAFLFANSEQPVAAAIDVFGVLTTMESVTTTTIRVDQIGTHVPQVGDMIVPALDCHPNFQVEGGLESCEALEYTIAAEEIAGTNTLLSVRGPLPPPEYDTYRGWPIFEPNHNWVDGPGVGWAREATATAVGYGTQVAVDGLRPSATSTFSLLERRAAYWSFLRLWDSRRGSLLPLWVVTELPLSPTPITFTGGVTSVLPEAKPITFTNAVALRPVGGGQTLVRVAVISGTTLTVDSAVPAGDYTVLYAYLGRFTDDVLTEEWQSCDIVNVQVSTIEIFETDLEID